MRAPSSHLKFDNLNAELWRPILKRLEKNSRSRKRKNRKHKLHVGWAKSDKSNHNYDQIELHLGRSSWNIEILAAMNNPSKLILNLPWIGLLSSPRSPLSLVDAPLCCSSVGSTPCSPCSPCSILCGMFWACGRGERHSGHHLNLGSKSVSPQLGHCILSAYH